MFQEIIDNPTAAILLVLLGGFIANRIFKLIKILKQLENYE